MRKYINVIINSKTEATNFDNFCTQYHIQNLYDPENTIYPHYRIICMGSDIETPTAVWEVNSHWQQSILSSSIDTNGGGLYTVNELQVVYKHIYTHFLELEHRMEEVQNI